MSLTALQAIHRRGIGIVVFAETEVFERTDRHHPVDGVVEFLPRLQANLFGTRTVGFGKQSLDVLLLVVRQRQADHVDVVLLDRPHHGCAPAAADIEQRHAGLQTQLAECQVDLGRLRLFERHVVTLEVRAAIDLVAVLPEPDEVEFELNLNEVRIDVYRSSGSGGQSVNTTDSAVRVTHVPTGIVVAMQDEKSQLQNKTKALRVLRARLYELERERQQAEQAAERRSQIGSGQRAEKIRTYNFPENRLTDHRVHLTVHRLDKILEGELDEFTEALARDSLGVTLGDALAAATARLAEAGIESARLEAELLLARACDDCARALLYAELHRELSPEQEAACDANVRRRVQREPLAYVLGEWGFRRLTLKTDRRALIPRPETEIVVERALEHIRDEPDPDVLDVGTGTGAIALAIADEHDGARITAIDASPEALALAAENRELTGVNGRVQLVEHDLVVSNPPYVDPDELATLQPEVRDWEPRIALVARGATEAVARAATEALRPGGWLVLETAAGTGERIRGLLDELGYERVTITPDLAGRDRVVEGKWKG